MLTIINSICNLKKELNLCNKTKEVFDFIIEQTSSASKIRLIELDNFIESYKFSESESINMYSFVITYKDNYILIVENIYFPELNDREFMERQRQKQMQYFKQILKKVEEEFLK